MGRLSDLFDHHKDNVEEGVKKALGKADDTLEVLRKRLEEVEAKLRDIAGDAPTSQHRDQATEKDLNAQNTDGVVTSDRTNNPPNTSVAAEADQSARKNTRSKK
jgi:hypothetical protein